MAGAKTAIVLDIRKIKKDGTYPVKLRVTFDRKQQYYPTPHDISEKEFERVMFGKKLTSTDKKLKIKITAYESKAIAIVKDLQVFTWQIFEKYYLNNRGAKDSIFMAFTDCASKLREAGQIGTAVSYECSQRSINKFAEGAKFVDITPELLKKYENWMLSNGSSITTVSIYLRSLRALFNTAIDEGMITKEYYPFGKKRYEIPTGNNVKKALTLKDIGAIYNYKAKPGSMADRSKNYWLFMYLSNGINVKDMCLLKYQNIKDDVLEFERAKTVRTKRKVEPIRVAFTDEIKDIVKNLAIGRKTGIHLSSLF